MMKKSGYISLGGISAALSLVCMLLAYFPYFTYLLPALAGFMLIPLVYEIGCRYALSVYLVTATASFFLCEKEAAILYIFFFGLYPIIKSVFETKIRNKTVEYILKFLFFNFSVIVAYLIIVNVFGIPLDTSERFSKYTVAVLLIAGNLTFAFFDVALTRMISMYARRLHKTVNKLIGR